MTEAGEVQVTLAANPSHLEAVDPVVEGLARAEQTDRSAGAGIHDPTVALPILIHGDASFAGQGVVAETFNLHAVEGYTTGGTLHVIANNQIGFTTDPTESRSTRYASDLAKGSDPPTIPVNADDPHGQLLLDAAQVPTTPYSFSEVDGLELTAASSSFNWRGHRISVPIGGRHNVSNALAAATAAGRLP